MILKCQPRWSKNGLPTSLTLPDKLSIALRAAGAKGGRAAPGPAHAVLQRHRAWRLRERHRQQAVAGAPLAQCPAPPLTPHIFAWCSLSSKKHSTEHVHVMAARASRRIATRLLRINIVRDQNSGCLTVSRMRQSHLALQTPSQRCPSTCARRTSHFCGTSSR